MWKKIEGYEKYEVSDRGKARSLDYNNSGKVQELKTRKDRSGNLLIGISKGNKKADKTLSRVVYETFSGKKLGRNDIIMYRDGNKENCSYENLYLIGRGKRQEETYEAGRRREDRLGREYLKKYKFYNEEVSIKEIARRTGIDRERIQGRIRDAGWGIEEAAEVPIAIYKKKGSR